MPSQTSPLSLDFVLGALRTVARRRGIITYGEVLTLAGFASNDPLKLKELRNHLYTISIAENAHGRPLLSVVVVNDGTGRCGSGFHKMAKSCGAQGGIQDDAFFISELNKVHKFWSK